MKTVTQDNWGVSTMSGDGLPKVILQVYRTYLFPERIGTREYTKIALGDANGKSFDTTDQAFAYALERGYLKPYYNRRGNI